jgi:hypothetical protein
VHDADAPGALSSADAARAALADFDSNAQSFFVSLRPEPQQMPLDFLVHVGLLPPEQLGVTRTLGGDTMEVARARADALAIEGARYALLERRKLALEHFRRGFLGAMGAAGSASMPQDDEPGCLDVTRHLALFTPVELSLMLGGKESLSATELIEMIDWPNAKEALETWGTDKPAVLLRTYLVGLGDLSSTRPLDLFKCITARRAVPAHMQERITLAAARSPKDDSVYDGRAAAEVYTCFAQLKLPKYESLEQLEHGLNELLAQKEMFTSR